MEIKTITFHYAYSTYTLTRYTNNNKSIYVSSGGYKVSKDDLNHEYITFKNMYGEGKQTDKTIDYKQFIEEQQNNIDEYPDYIDNYNQYKMAIANNDRITRLILYLKKIE